MVALLRPRTQAAIARDFPWRRAANELDSLFIRHVSCAKLLVTIHIEHRSVLTQLNTYVQVLSAAVLSAAVASAAVASAAVASAAVASAAVASAAVASEGIHAAQHPGAQARLYPYPYPYPYP
jgi:hypothetical protein